jgi:hypothetical protein
VSEREGERKGERGGGREFGEGYNNTSYFKSKKSHTVQWITIYIIFIELNDIFNNYS